jgi:hypothetical protein
MREDTTGRRRRLLGGSRQHESPLNQVGACSTLLHLSSHRLPGLTSSSPGQSTNIMGPTILKKSSRCITRSFRPLEVMIGWRPTISPRLYPMWLDHSSSICSRKPSTTGISYVPCSTSTSRAHMSDHQPLELWKLSSWSTMKASRIIWNISTMSGTLFQTSRTLKSSMSSVMGSPTSRLLRRSPWRSQ